MSLLAPFESVLNEPRSGSHPPTIAWLGLDVPVEIIEAAGCAPLRVRADAAFAGEGAETLGEGGGHPGMRAQMARLLDGSLEPLSRAAIGAMPVTGVWIYNLLLSLGEGRPGGVRWPVDLVDVARWDRPSAITHNRHSMARFAAALGLTPDAEALKKAVHVRNGLRANLRHVEALRSGPAPRLTGVAARTVLDAADLMPSSEASARVQHFLANVADLPTVSGAPVIYSGTGGPSLALYRALEALDLRIVADDQDFGTRAIGPDVLEDGDPIAALADRYRQRDAASAGWTTAARTASLLGLARARGARAVVFEIASFDHTAAWDHPKQAEALIQAGIQPILLPPDAWRDPIAAVRDCASKLKGAVHV